MKDNILFKRKAYEEMVQWKISLADKYALLVEGARRVGKTHLIKEFVEKEYESCIFIDFSSKSPLTNAAKRAFRQESSIQGLIERLTIISGVRLIEGHSCLVFDEVQRFPQAREMIKQFVEYGKYHYIESGSLLGIRTNVANILIPSEEHKRNMYPMDFEEFLDALGETVLKKAIRRCFDERRAMGPDIHEKAMKLYRTYMVVGGMPQSVDAYLMSDGNRLEAAEVAKREILSLYDSDVGKYAKALAPKVRAVFRHIPSALSRREKRFHLTELDRNARMRRYENAFLWLDEAKVVNTAYSSSSPDVGLAMNLNDTKFKCYYSDTGLLLTQAMAGTRDVNGQLLRAVLYDRIGVNEGMFFENVVAQTLVSRGYELLFYSKTDPTDAEKMMEIDFLFPRGIKTCPIEVKSSKFSAHVSLDRLIARFGKHLGPRYVVCTRDYAEEGGIVYLPVYMTHCL